MLQARALAHEADPPDLAGQRPQASADLDAVLVEQCTAHGGLVDIIGHMHGDELGQALGGGHGGRERSEEHTSELQSRFDLVCRLLLAKKKKITTYIHSSY